MDPVIKARMEEWLTSPEYDEATKNEIRNLLDAGNETELEDRFYRDLEFGTGGLRGVQGAGTNRMNIYNVRKVTQGLANYILKMNLQDKGVVIGRDSRINSDRFAENAASVLAANGIRVFYYKDIHPTPTASFGVRYFGAAAGIMITASHNPKQYNGYKVFWDDGAQVTPPHDTGIIAEVKKIAKLSQVKGGDFAATEKSGLFRYIDDEIDPVFLEKTMGLMIHPECIASSGVKICYSPFNGAGYRLIPEALRKLGFKDVSLVAEQAQPDGNFPTIPSPNPELPDAMKLGISTAKRTGADVLIASDPDADRVGAALRQSDGSFLLLNGNQIATLLVYYVCSESKATGRLKKNPFIVSTIVTTPVLIEIAKSFGIDGSETLTGFKWIGLVTKERLAKGDSFLFGCEESHGYNAADYVRDKDAVNAACLFAEMTAYYKSKGVSVAEKLDRIYMEYGYYRETQSNIYIEGMEGAAKIKAIMENLRANPPKAVAGRKVLTVTDILEDTVTDVATGKVAGKSGLPKSNVLSFAIEGSVRIVARPSGTEPKIKFYYSVKGVPGAGETVTALKTRTDAEHDQLKAEFLKIAGA